MMKEEWRQIQAYEGLYEISNLGQVKALDKLDSLGRKVKQKIMSPNVSTGYARVGLHKEGQKKMLLVHRLVAIAFIPNQENKTEVNHIDGNKFNNMADNLEWNTPKENTYHAWNIGLASASHSYTGPVLVYDKQGTHIDTLYGSKDMKSKGYDSSSISKCINGQAKTHRGCTFKKEIN